MSFSRLSFIQFNTIKVLVGEIMKKVTFLVLCGIIILTSCSSIQSPVYEHAPNKINEQLLPSLPADFMPKPIKITAIGDSLTEGVGDSQHKGGYLQYLQKDLLTLKGVSEVNITNLGISGNRSTQILDRLRKEDVKEKISQANMVLITVGGNDIMKIVRENFMNLQMDVFNREQIIYEQRLNEIFQTVRAYNPDGTIILIGLYNPFSHWFSDIKEFQEILNNWNEIGKTVVSQYENSYFVDIYDTFSENSLELLYEDQFHPNDKGYELIADQVFLTLKDEVEPVPSNEWFVIKESDEHE